jgi:hypothetical protein
MMKALPKLLLIGLLPMLFTQCIVDSSDDDEPIVEPMPTYTLRLSIDRMKANLTCEGPNGTDQLADIYTSLLLAEGHSFPATIAEQNDKLVQLGLGGQTSDTGLEIEVEVEFEHDTRFSCFINTYENDPGGWDIQTIFGEAITFDGEQECWIYNGECFPGSDEFPHEFKMSNISRMADERCDIEYEWTFELLAN